MLDAKVVAAEQTFRFGLHRTLSALDAALIAVALDALSGDQVSVAHVVHS